MSDTNERADLQAMIERAGRLTEEESGALGAAWTDDEDIVIPEPSASLAIQGGADGAMVTNPDLVAAWEHALEVAGAAGRVDEIEAAREAGRAVRHAEVHRRDRSNVEEAVRSAVLAVGVSDLIPASERDALTGAWRRVLGEV